jgi:hypothetical protein
MERKCSSHDFITPPKSDESDASAKPPTAPSSAVLCVGTKSPNGINFPDNQNKSLGVISLDNNNNNSD